MKTFYFKVELKPVGGISDLKYVISDKPLAPGKKGKGEFIVIKEKDEIDAINDINEIKKKTVFVLNDYLTTENPTGEKPKKCKEKGCGGIIDLNQPVSLMTGCSSYSTAYPCNKCGRLHWYGKNPRGVYNRRHEKAFSEVKNSEVER